MPDVQVENFVPNTANDTFNVHWKLTRALKASGWRYKASSDGTTKDTTGNPANDKWGGGVTVQGPTTAAFTIGAASSTSFGGRSTLTGLAGFTSASPGHFLTITGATNAANNGTWLITSFISATSVVIENPAAVAETTPGTATYTELSALTDTYPAAITGTSGSGAWWCAQGPSTLKVPIGSSTPTGTFLRGENVTQTTSGAKGEILGVVIDSGGNGYLVIAPRVSGTGGGPRGWSTNLITGASSGATVTPSATVIEYVREIVFWKGSTTATQGHIYFQVIDQNTSTEGATTAATGRFSTLAALGTATATICPGGATGNPTGNGFPVIGSYVPLGQGGSGAAGTGSNNWMSNSTSVASNHCFILVANCIEDTAISADGTMTVVGATAANSYIGWGFHRVDDQEDGDVDPYVWAMYDSRAANSRSRILGNHTNASTDIFRSGFWVASGVTQYVGWRRRGYPTGDSWIEMAGYASGCYGSTPFYLQNATNANPSTVACAFVTTHVREPIYIASNGSNTTSKFRKGILRWWFLVAREATSGTNAADTFDGIRWIQFSSTNAALLVGPADQSTVPINP